MWVQQNSNQPAHLHSLIRVCCPHEGTLHPCLSKMLHRNGPSKGSDQAVQMRRLIWSFSWCTCPRYFFLKWWLHYRSHIVTKTYLYNFNPLKPHFYIVKLGFTGVNIIFLISAQKHRLFPDCCFEDIIEWNLIKECPERRQHPNFTSLNF